MAIGCWCCCYESVDTIVTSHNRPINTVSQTSTDVRQVNIVGCSKSSSSTTGIPTPLTRNPTTNQSRIPSKEQSVITPTKTQTVGQSEIRRGKRNKARSLPLPKNINHRSTRPLPMPKSLIPTTSLSGLNHTSINQRTTTANRKTGTYDRHFKGKETVTRPLPIPRRPLSPIRQQGTSASYVRNPKEGENRKDNPESQNQGRQKTTCLLRGSQSPSSLPKGAKKKKKRQKPKEQIQQTNTSPTKDRQSQERGSMCRAPIRERLHPDCARSDTEYTNNAERNVLRRFDENGVECTIVNGVYIPKLDLSWLDEDKPIDVVTKSPEEPKEKRRSIRSRIYSARRKRMKQRALEREGSQQNTMVEENPSIVNSEIVNDTARKETCHSTSTMLDPLSVRGTTVEVNEQRASIHSIRVDPNTDEDKKPSQGTVNSGTMDVEKIENITKDETEKSKSKSRKHDQSRNSNAVKGFKKEFLNKRSNVEYTDYSVFLADSACSTVQKHPEKKRGAWDKMEVYREISEEIKEEKKSFKQKLQGLKKYLISKKNHWTAKVSTGDGGPPQAPKKKKFELILKFSKI